MGASHHRLVVDKQTHDLIMRPCKEVFLENNPKFRGMRITQNFIVRKLAEYYLQDEDIDDG